MHARPVRQLIERLGRLPSRWRQAAFVAAAVVACELGARIVLPGLNGDVLREYLRHDPDGWLRGLYDTLVGGALSRGALLALGILPYVSARIVIRLLRTTSPTLQRLAESDEGEAVLTRGTRWLTVGLALVQSYGYVRFTQGIPGVVAIPGAAFVATTVAVLTSGTIVLMLLSERITGSGSRRVHAPPQLGAAAPATLNGSTITPLCGDEGPESNQVRAVFVQIR